MQQRFVGPYKVAENLGKGTYRLQNAKTGHITKKIVNACRLKRYTQANKMQPTNFCEDSLFQFGSPSPDKTKSIAHEVNRKYIKITHLLMNLFLLIGINNTTEEVQKATLFGRGNI